ncbi:hypothetical protein [Caballeronia sp. SBC1]|uniref:hypothetical protein n=1 Tax=Caballeronia sp. SBC1 TaxID=2705548 RepID=UPI001A9DAF8E|nr:hypothetical protein [Caballeronia sp. SBC1]
MTDSLKIIQKMAQAASQCSPSAFIFWFQFTPARGKHAFDRKAAFFDHVGQRGVSREYLATVL